MGSHSAATQLHIQYVRHFGNGNSDLHCLCYLHCTKCPLLQRSYCPVSVVISHAGVRRMLIIIIVMRVCLCVCLRAFNTYILTNVVCTTFSAFLSHSGQSKLNHAFWNYGQTKMFYCLTSLIFRIPLFNIFEFMYIPTYDPVPSSAPAPLPLPHSIVRVVERCARRSRLNRLMMSPSHVVCACGVRVKLYFVNDKFARVFARSPVPHSPFSFSVNDVLLCTDCDELSSPVYRITSAKDGIRQSRRVSDKFNRKI